MVKRLIKVGKDNVRWGRPMSASRVLTIPSWWVQNNQLLGKGSQVSLEMSDDKIVVRPIRVP